MENPYHVLGLSNLATDKEIQARYRKLAFKFHPDRNPEQREEAERNFKRVKEAYDLLRQRKENQFERTEYRSGTSSRSSYRQDSRKTQTRNAYYTGQHYSGFSRTSNRSTRYHSGSCILSEGSSFSSRPPRMLDIHGLQILVFTLVASTSIAVLFGDSWWKKLNRGKSFEDMMKQRRILRPNRVRLEQED